MSAREIPSRTREEASIRMEALKNNTYPGRGIVMGLNKAGDLAVQVYWLMGRGEGSRNRTLVCDENGVLSTKVYDEKKEKGDPSRTLYNAMTRVGDFHVVTNGLHTDTITQSLASSPSLEVALRDEEPEDDPPIFTPRISGLITMDERPEFVFSIIKRRRKGGQSDHQYFFPQEEIIPGVGYCIHTYKENGEPPPSFQGNPYPVLLGDGRLDIMTTFWKLLNRENRVSVAVKIISLKSGRYDYSVMNRHSGPSSYNAFIPEGRSF